MKLYEQAYMLHELGYRPSEIAAVLYPDLYRENPKKAVRRVNALLNYARRRCTPSSWDSITQGVYNQQDTSMKFITEDLFDVPYREIESRYSTEEPLYVTVHRGRFYVRERDIRSLKDTKIRAKRVAAELQHLVSILLNLRSDNDRFWKIFNDIERYSHVVANERVYVRSRGSGRISPRAAAFLYLIILANYIYKPELRWNLLKELAKYAKVDENEILRYIPEILPKLWPLFA